MAWQPVFSLRIGQPVSSVPHLAVGGVGQADTPHLEQERAAEVERHVIDHRGIGIRVSRREVVAIVL